MKIFRRLFDKTPKSEKPDNSRLLKLLENYWKADGKGSTYENVVGELVNGNSFLMVPGENGLTRESAGWMVSKEKTTLKLTSVYTLDGLKALAVFTDEKAL